MSLTLRQLEVFLAAAQDCNFRRTADRLGISQPSVSGRIKSIEAHLGYDLFDRSSGTSPRLTFEGSTFVDKARQLISSANQLSPDRRSRSARTSRLKVLVGPWLLKQRVMPALSDFCFENPGIDADFEPIRGVTPDHRDLILSGEADVLLYTGDPPEDNRIDTQVLGTTRCSIFGAPELLARVDTSSNTGIAAAPFILPPEHHAPASWVRARLAAAGITPTNIVARPQFPDLVVQMMIEGRGLSVFFDEFLRNERLRSAGPALAPARRVLIIGPRARRPSAAPLLEFLRTSGATSDDPQ